MFMCAFVFYFSKSLSHSRQLSFRHSTLQIIFIVFRHFYSFIFHIFSFFFFLTPLLSIYTYINADFCFPAYSLMFPSFPFAQTFSFTIHFSTYTHSYLFSSWYFSFANSFSPFFFFLMV